MESPSHRSSSTSRWKWRLPVKAANGNSAHRSGQADSGWLRLLMTSCAWGWWIISEDSIFSELCSFHCQKVWTSKTAGSCETYIQKMCTKYRKAQFVLWYGGLFLRKLSLVCTPFKKSVIVKNCKIPLRHILFSKRREYPHDVIFNRIGLEFTCFKFASLIRSSLASPWFDRGFPVAWPPRFLNETACNFFCSYILYRLLNSFLTTIAMLRAIIWAFVASITEKAVHKVLKEGMSICFWYCNEM